MAREQKRTDLINEIRVENQLSPLFSDDAINIYIDSGIQEIDNACGVEVDYEEDLEARTLLKNYVLYSHHKRLAEFREVYVSEYTKLQIKYYSTPNIP